MEVTLGFKTRSVVLLFRFGSESGAIHPKIVCDGTGKNAAAVRVVCIKCNQSQDCVQPDRQECRRIVCGLHRMLSIPGLCATGRAKMRPDRVWSASNAMHPRLCATGRAKMPRIASGLHR